MDAFDKMQKTFEFPSQKTSSNSQKLTLPPSPPPHPDSPYYQPPLVSKGHFQPNDLSTRQRLFGVNPSSPLGVALFKQSLRQRPTELQNMKDFGWMIENEEQV